MVQIRLENLNKSFGDVDVIHDVSLTINDGEFCVFVGPSGCGKSTLLRLIAGLEDATSGKIVIGGDDVTRLEPYDRQLSMVFQSYALYPHMSVRENIEFALRTVKTPDHIMAAKVAEASRILRLDKYLDRKPADLSGGQRQRVAIGRAIVRQPKAFLFDEPLSNLDAALRSDTRVEIAALHHSLNSTMVYVTHDQIEAMTLADRIVVLEGGRVMQVGSPEELYRTPANVFVAQFLGSPKMNVLDAKFDDKSIVVRGHQPIGVTSVYPVGGGYLGMRPEAISVVDPGSGQFVGDVVLSEYHGATRTVVANIGEARNVTLQTPESTITKVGDRIGLQCDVGHFHVFDQGGQRLDAA